MSLFEQLRFGSSYYPPHHDPGDWPRDLDRMVEAGLNTIRTAELLASWDRIEVAPHRYDFGWLDQIFDLAGERGIKVLLGTGSCCPPIWMASAYADLQVMSRDGVPYPTASTWGWACKDHPGYRDEVERWVRDLAERYGQREELLGWQIDNEAGFPFVARDGKGMDWYCYCPNTERAFRLWLRDRYPTPQALSDAWRWDPTNHRYSDWSEIRPPRSLPMEWGPVTAWLDWRRFLADDLADWIGWQRDLLGQLTPAVPTSTNGFIWSRHDPFGVRMAQDPWRLARRVDAIGYDLYPGIDRRFLDQPEYVGMFLDYARSSARRSGAEFWLPELESGPINGWVLGPDYATTGADIVRMNAEGLGAGATVLLYQGYREWNCIPIHWGALVDLQGQPTERLTAAGAVARSTQPEADLLLNADCPPAPVAILHDFDNAVVVSGMGAGDVLLEAVTGAYRAFAGAGFPVDFVSYSDLDVLDCNLLVLPFTMVLPEAAGQAIARYVETGGHLLTFAKTAMLQGNGWYWNIRPGAGLHRVLGVREQHVEAVLQPVPVQLPASARLPGWGGGSVSGDLIAQSFVVGEGAEVLGTTTGGAAVLTRHAYGSGAAWAVGTHLDVACARRPDEGTAALLAAIAESAGGRRLLEATLATDGLPRLFARLRISGARGLATVTSTADNPTTGRLLVTASAATDLMTGEKLNLDGDGLPISLEPRGTRMLLLEGLT